MVDDLPDVLRVILVSHGCSIEVGLDRESRMEARAVVVNKSQQECQRALINSGHSIVVTSECANTWWASLVWHNHPCRRRVRTGKARMGKETTRLYIVISEWHRLLRLAWRGFLHQANA